VTRNKAAANSVTGGAFASQVSAITSAFGDPTRRAVYLYVRDANEGVTATQVAEQFEVHPNVARHHLDKLAAGGYLEVEVVPVRSDDLVLSLLGEALERLPRDAAEAMAKKSVENTDKQWRQGSPVMTS